METLIKQYLQSKVNAWADSTRRSEAARLHATKDVLNCLPAEAFDRLGRRLKPYSVKTAMLRLAACRAFGGDHSWSQWIKDNARVFKGAYKRSVDGLSFEEIKRRASLLTDVHTKNIVNELLHSGTRASEIRSRVGNNVVGKGSKSRALFGAATLTVEERTNLSYSDIHNACKALGTTPHACRKAFASKLARSGKVTEVDLLKIMGWESMETAKSYLQPMRDEQLSQTIGDVLSGRT
jgi:integrase